MPTDDFEPLQLVIVHQSVWDALVTWADEHNADWMRMPDGSGDDLPSYFISPRSLAACDCPKHLCLAPSSCPRHRESLP